MRKAKVIIPEVIQKLKDLYKEIDKLISDI